MVCSANICRSPMAQGVMMRELELRGLKNKVKVDSAGTQVFKPGHRPDQRAQQVAKKSTINIRKMKARSVVTEDFLEFDYIIAMDQENLSNLEAMCPEELRDKLHLLLEFAPEGGLREVPDPYFGNLSGFERVLVLLDQGCKRLVEHICVTHKLCP